MQKKKAIRNWLIGLLVLVGVAVFLLFAIPFFKPITINGKIVPYKFTLESGHAVIHSYLGEEEEVHVPARILFHSVTVLEPEKKGSEYPFYGNKTIKKVVLPNTVTELSKNCFKNCTNLEEVIFSKRLKIIGENCFNGCLSLKEIVLPDGLQQIGKTAFCQCNQLKSVTIPDSVTSLKSSFISCRKLEDVRISENVTGIDGKSFWNTPWRNAIQDEFLIVGRNCLIGYQGNDDVVHIPNGVEFLGEDVLDKDKIRIIYLPKSMSKLDLYTLNYFNKLEKVFIANEAMKLNNYVTSDNGGELDFVVVTNVGENQVIHNNDLCLLYLANDIIEFEKKRDRKAEIEEMNEKIEKFLNITVPTSCIIVFLLVVIPYMKTVTINVFFIPYHFSIEKGSVIIHAYKGKSRTLTLPSTLLFHKVRRIQEYYPTELRAPFYQNTKVRKVVIPDTVTEISNFCFMGCTALEKVKLSSNLKKIGKDCFKDCTSLKTIIFPGSIEFIGEGAFMNTPWRDSYPSEFIIIKGKYLIGYTGSDKEVAVPDGVEFIGGDTFNTDIVEVIHLPESIAAIDLRVFENCKNLQKLIIENHKIVLSSNRWEKPAFKLVVAPGSEGERYARENELAFETVIGEKHWNNP